MRSRPNSPEGGPGPSCGEAGGRSFLAEGMGGGVDAEKPLWLGQSERGRAAWGEFGPGSWTGPRVTFPGCWGLCFVFRVQQERWHLTGSRSLGTKEKLRLGEGENLCSQ